MKLRYTIIIEGDETDVREMGDELAALVIDLANSYEPSISLVEEVAS